jgi:hypothetical protein
LADQSDLKAALQCDRLAKAAKRERPGQAGAEVTDRVKACRNHEEQRRGHLDSFYFRPVIDSEFRYEDQAGRKQERASYPD